MTWTIQTDTKYDKALRKANLMTSEENKLNAWLGDLAGMGPYKAAEHHHIKCTKLNGYDEWHLYLGSYARVFFSVDSFSTVKLHDIGHT
jgi:hypothetical protein